jgi:hypothetical protein
MPEEKNIIEKFDKKFKDKWWDEVCFEMEWGNGQKHQRTMRMEIHQFLLTELQALKEEVVGKELYKYGEWLNDRHMALGWNSHRKETIEAFEKRGIK